MNWLRALGALAMLALVVFAFSAVAGCRRAPVAVAPADAAPPFTVRDDSQGLLLTWIDEKGDFHVEQKVADVPMIGRDAVRAVDPAREDAANAETVYVADLRVASLDGAYPVHTMTRDAFDALALTRREKSDKPTL